MLYLKKKKIQVRHVRFQGVQLEILPQTLETVNLAY